MMKTHIIKKKKKRVPWSMDHGNGQTGVRDINTNVCNLVKK